MKCNHAIAIEPFNLDTWKCCTFDFFFVWWAPRGDEGPPGYFLKQSPQNLFIVRLGREREEEEEEEEERGGME
jgi:hypothetical protein